MVTVICGTNRPENTTRLIANTYCKLLAGASVESQLFSLEDLPADFAFRNEAYGSELPPFVELVDKYVRAVNKIAVISPEYNGSMPGVLKTFIDGVKPEDWHGKKMALVGVASGRAGNLRGLDHLTNILHYLDVEVLPLKVPISGIYNLLGEGGSLADPDTIQVLTKQIDRFVQF